MVVSKYRGIRGTTKVSASKVPGSGPISWFVASPRLLGKEKEGRTSTHSLAQRSSGKLII